MPVPRISREELKARLDSPDSSSHPLIIDVRLKYPYEHSTVRLPGAQHIHPDAITSATLPPDRDIVLYDSDPEDIVSTRAAADLQRRGHRVLVLQGGIGEWMNAKLPVDTKTAPQPAAAAAKPAGSAAAKPPAPRPPAPAAASATPAASTSADPAGTEGPGTPSTESKP